MAARRSTQAYGPHALGAAAENAVAAALVANGLQILLRNWRRRTGELDIVAKEGDILVIVEVRLRSGADFGGPAASVDVRKRRRIIRTTQQLLQQRPEFSRLRLRFDVVAVQPASSGQRRVTITPLRDPENQLEMEWIRHAFSAAD